MSLWLKTLGISTFRTIQRQPLRFCGCLAGAGLSSTSIPLFIYQGEEWYTLKKLPIPLHLHVIWPIPQENRFQYSPPAMIYLSHPEAGVLPFIARFRLWMRSTGVVRPLCAKHTHIHPCVFVSSCFWELTFSFLKLRPLHYKRYMFDWSNSVYSQVVIGGYLPLLLQSMALVRAVQCSTVHNIWSSKRH